MGSVGFLFWVFCLAVIGSGGYARGSVVNHRFIDHKKEKDYESVIRIAEKEVGLREEGAANCGRRVEAYLNYVGFAKGAPWCAAAVSFWFHLAGFEQPRTAWSPALFPSWRIAGGRPRPGLVFGLYFPALGRIGHCGLVWRVSGENVYTIEGNTSTAGSREGDGVYRRIRNRRLIAKFSDWLGHPYARD